MISATKPPSPPKPDPAFNFDHDEHQPRFSKSRSSTVASAVTTQSNGQPPQKPLNRMSPRREHPIPHPHPKVPREILVDSIFRIRGDSIETANTLLPDGKERNGTNRTKYNRSNSQSHRGSHSRASTGNPTTSGKSSTLTRSTGATKSQPFTVHVAKLAGNLGGKDIELDVSKIVDPRIRDKIRNNVVSSASLQDIGGASTASSTTDAENEAPKLVIPQFRSTKFIKSQIEAVANAKFKFDPDKYSKTVAEPKARSRNSRTSKNLNKEFDVAKVEHGLKDCRTVATKKVLDVAPSNSVYNQLPRLNPSFPHGESSHDFTSSLGRTKLTIPRSRKAVHTDWIQKTEETKPDINTFMPTNVERDIISLPYPTSILPFNYEQPPPLPAAAYSNSFSFSQSFSSPLLGFPSPFNSPMAQTNLNQKPTSVPINGQKTVPRDKPDSQSHTRHSKSRHHVESEIGGLGHRESVIFDQEMQNVKPLTADQQIGLALGFKFNLPSIPHDDLTSFSAPTTSNVSSRSSRSVPASTISELNSSQADTTSVASPTNNYTAPSGNHKPTYDLYDDSNRIMGSWKRNADALEAKISVAEVALNLEDWWREKEWERMIW
ncbi:hypothetical protein BKA69DRAFT_1057762 [Paraphysoderma sedebokerense]|nr:hypothetical protein BKA69DRAFT_1057762 [Paraphysoderma sedebokerense]